MPRGRERILDEGKQREVCALVSAGCSLQAAASYVECATNTIRREAARNPDFGRRFRDARLQAQLSPLQAMRKAASSHWRAAAWILERSDPDHFARRPAPAFRPKQAQALRNDIIAILNAEIDNPFLLRRIKKQIQHLIAYSINGVVSVDRTHRDLRSVLSFIDKLERQNEQEAQTEPSVAEMLQALGSRAEGDNSKRTADPANVPPTNADSPPRPALPLRAHWKEVCSSAPDP